MKRERNKTLCIIQARMGSTRLPGKVLKEVNGVPLLEYMVRRVRQSKNVGKIVIATTTKPEDDVIEMLCKKLGIDCFRGSEKDVLDRYYQCAKRYSEYDTIVRLTADCPLIDPYLIDEFVSEFAESNIEYLNSIEEFGKETYPEGVADIDVFSRAALMRAADAAQLPSEREHVTLFFRNNPDIFAIKHISAPEDHSYYRLTVDTERDFEVVRFLIEHANEQADYKSLIRLLEASEQVAKINMSEPRLEGLQRSLEEDHKDSKTS